MPGLLLANRIADMIVSTALPPGTHLTAQSLAERLGVSRTPVRESLRTLEAFGLVDYHDGRGAYVVDPATMSAHERRDLIVTRRWLEPPLLRQAASRADDTDLIRIAEALDAGDRSIVDGDLGGLNVAHRHLLSAFASASHNDAAEEALRPLHFRTCLIVARTAPVALSQGWRQHRATYLAVAAGDGDLAARLQREHLDEVVAGIS